MGEEGPASVWAHGGVCTRRCADPQVLVDNTAVVVGDILCLDTGDKVRAGGLGPLGSVRGGVPGWLGLSYCLARETSCALGALGRWTAAGASWRQPASRVGAAAGP